MFPTSKPGYVTSLKDYEGCIFSEYFSSSVCVITIYLSVRAISFHPVKLRNCNARSTAY